MDNKKEKKFIKALCRGDTMLLFLARNGEPLAQIRLHKHADIQENSELLEDVTKAYKKYLKAVNEDSQIV